MSSSICDVERRQYEELNDLYKSRGEEIGRLNKELTSLEKENKELKEITDGIMNEEGTEYILGCNAHEKFCQAMCELNYDEEWITELKAENKELKQEVANHKEDWEELEDLVGSKPYESGPRVRDLLAKEKENKKLEEQLEHHQGWFQEIEEMLGTHDGCVVPMVKNLLAENQQLKKKIVS